MYVLVQWKCFWVEGKLAIVIAVAEPRLTSVKKAADISL